MYPLLDKLYHIDITMVLCAFKALGIHFKSREILSCQVLLF